MSIFSSTWYVSEWSGMGLTMCCLPRLTGWKFRLISLLSSIGVVARPSSLGLRYILGFFFLPLKKKCVVENVWLQEKFRHNDDLDLNNNTPKSKEEK